MRKFAFLCLIVGLFPLCTSAKQQEQVNVFTFSGNQLYEWCQAGGEKFATCKGYIMGAVDNLAIV